MRELSGSAGVRYHGAMSSLPEMGPILTGSLVAGVAAVRPTIRHAQRDDAAAIHRLAGQLGYAIDGAAVNVLISAAEDDVQQGRTTYPASAILVAVVREGDAEHVCGWAEVRLERSLLGSWAEIIGLIVDATVRGRGIGSELVDHAVQWARAHGQTRLRVRTNTRRTRAATFYQGLGFAESKQQRIFERVV